jgi:pepF/M3 family oligoendopeptidase
VTTTDLTERTGVPPRWDLTPIFGGLDDRAFTNAVERVYADVDRMAAFFDEHDVRAIRPRRATADDAVVLAQIIDASNALQTVLRKIDTYLYARITTDSRDDAAAALEVELRTRSAPLGPLTKRLGAWVAALGVDDLVQLHPTAAEHAFALQRAAARADFQMSEAEESLAAELAPSASLAWQRLQGDVSSQLTVDLHVPGRAPERIPMTMARGLATHPDAARRRAAYEGELAAWETVAVPLAAALNGAKGELAVLNRRRGFVDDVEPVLQANNVDRVTLDAMTDAVVAALPDFRSYLRAKARVLRHDGPLPWWDLFAPVSGAEEVDWSRATELVGAAFNAYSPHLGALADRAFAERWVDAEIREGKRGGAYCAGVEDDVSRVLMNFDGSVDAVSTLAHELGHAYHNTALAPRTPLQRRLPMALAETASIFCETLLFDTALAHAGSDAERLALLDTNLVGATQVVVDIHSRYLFELELARLRRRTTLSVHELCELMLGAQEQSYGDGLDPQHRHAYMWAVKPHYFTPFYNWPYTFGLLFGIGLFARYREDPDRFRAGYDELLSSTGLADAATLAGRFGIDVRDRAFWDASVDVLRGHIAEYGGLVDAVPRPT